VFWQAEDDADGRGKLYCPVLQTEGGSSDTCVEPARSRSPC
jgi:hypothetical protein